MVVTGFVACSVVNAPEDVVSSGGGGSNVTVGGGGSGGGSGGNGTGGGAECVSPGDCPPPGFDCRVPACAQGSCTTANAPEGTPCGNGLTCTAAGTCEGCTGPADCPGDDGPCQTRTCTGGTCGFDFAPQGTVYPDQIPGDCAEAICDGNGAVTQAADDADVPADGNDCTDDLCSGGVPSNDFTAPSTPCSQDGGVVCSGAGACVECAAPSDCPTIAHGSPSCTNNTCGIASCTAPWADCVNGPSDGCETNTDVDPQHCGNCPTTCQAPTPTCSGGNCVGCQGTFLTNFGGQAFYKVPVSGTMTDTNLYNACIAAGCRVPCDGQAGCQYNDNLCTLGAANDCSNPMMQLAQLLCGTGPSSCAALNGVYQYMGNAWISNSACGVEGGSWCSVGSNYSNRLALCIQ